MAEKEEPAWRATLEEDLRMADLEEEPLWPVIELHIRIAEQRGRRGAALALAASSISDCCDECEAAIDLAVDFLRTGQS